MAILKIASMGNPALRVRAREVEEPTAPEVLALVRDMVDTLADAGGVGLAAPQVHVPLRVVIFHVPAGAEAIDKGEVAGANGEDRTGDEGEEVPLTALINPVIEPLGDETELGWEGCLSVPGLRGIVPRHRRIRYAAVGLDGKRIEAEAEGFHARVVQHECDHLDGILYPMRMTDLRLLGFNDELDRHPLQLADEGGETRPVRPEEQQA